MPKFGQSLTKLNYSLDVHNQHFELFIFNKIISQCNGIPSHETLSQSITLCKLFQSNNAIKCLTEIEVECFNFIQFFNKVIFECTSLSKNLSDSFRGYSTALFQIPGVSWEPIKLPL